MEFTRQQVLECLRVERVADAVAGRDFDTLTEALSALEQSASPLSELEIDEALAAHPRIGEQARGAGAEAAFSRAEQAASQDSDEHMDAALHDGNAQYEARFGRVFLIRAAGRSRREILDELQRRLLNDPGVETDEVAEQLRAIAALRLKQTWENA